MDIRILNTKNRIQEGLIASMREIPLYRLKDKDVIEKSEISSSSFYKYYSDKIEVLDDIEAELLKEYRTALNNDARQLRTLQFPPNKKDIRLFVDKNTTEIVEYFSEKKSTLAVLTSDKGDPGFTSELIEMTAQVVKLLMEHYFKLYGQEDILKQKKFKLLMLSKWYAFCFVGPLLFWLEHSDEMAIRDAKELILSMILKSPYDVSTHGF